MRLITQLARDSDAIADSWDAATSMAAAAKASADYDQKREALWQALASLADTQFWRVSTWLWWRNKLDEAGCGLLDARTWIYQRDLTIYGAYLKLYAALDGQPRATFVWRVESHAFVFPEKGPLTALIRAAEGLSEPPKKEVWDDIVSDLKADEYWLPDGRSSLDKLRARLNLAAQPGPSSQPAPPSDPDAVWRQREANARAALNRFHWSWAQVKRGLLGNPDDRTKLQELIDFRLDLTRKLMEQAAADAWSANHATISPYRWVRYAIPGSQRLTSDIDVNMRGSATEKVVALFNSKFRDWTLATDVHPQVALESGYVFDVNVYAQDYTRESGRRFLAADKPDPDLWPSSDKDALKRAKQWQDKYALLKMRRFMPDEEAQDATDRLRRDPRLAGQANDLGELFTAVEQLWITDENAFKTEEAKWVTTGTRQLPRRRADAGAERALSAATR